MHLTQRRATLFLLVIETGAAALGLIALAAMGMDPVSQRALMVAIPIFAALTIAYWRGWDWARYVNLLIALVMVCGPFIDPRLDRSFSPVALVPPALAIVTAGPWWIGGTALTILAVLNLRGGGFYARPDNVIIYLLIVSCMVIGRVIADQARTSAEETAAELEREHVRATEEAQAREGQAAELTQRNAEQQRLIELIRTLEIPTVALADDVLLAPLVGTFDDQRLHALAERLLHQVAARRTGLIVLDISGMALVSPELLQSLSGVTRALQLLGCRVALSGISPALAASLASRDISFPDVLTVPSPREALAHTSAQLKRI